MAQRRQPRQRALPPEPVAETVPPAPLAPRALWLALTPFLLLFVAQLLSWLWHVAGLAGTIGGTRPPTLLAMALLVAGGAWAFGRRLAPRWYAWGALGLSAVTALVQAAVIQVADNPREAAIGIPSLVVLGVAIVTAVVVAGRGVRHGLLFLVLFQAFPMARFPIVRVGDFVSAGEALALTAGMAAVAAVQTGLVLWLLRRFLTSGEAAQSQAVAMLAVLMLLHAAMTSWLLLFTAQPESPGTAYAAAVLTWMLFNLIFLALVYATGRMRQRWAASVQ